MKPIRVLDLDLINSVTRIAPEKIYELETLIFNYDPSIIFTNDKEFSFRVDTEKKEVKLPTVALEYLWCACYAFYVFYQEYFALNQEDRNPLDIYSSDRSQKAISLYNWGIGQLSQNPSIEWPSDLPMPTKYLTHTDEDVQVANELYLCSVSWIIHHELAHIYCGHKNMPVNDEESRAEESEADFFATNLILEGVADESILLKRGLGVVIAALVITTQDILAGEFKETTHPKSFKRLYKVLDSHFQDPDHLVYAFSVVICHLNMAAGGMYIKGNGSETWKENLETCLVQFSRLTKL
ncbi:MULTISPECIES: phage exclusion protein Lit family protein [unclassified Methylophaga]|jgi:hypothetical protein|uniref:phage exclusion protein Lit family protein n=1 Tax=unclassified Methylophaga TaxID=2629249 RepID=UPI000C95B486|nr:MULTISPECIES: phage exclusion protein Lit family protein [unclassified Methylophaga]MAK65577.1 hypothetical protein [Methylophaga sp.]MAY16300.1 hypothetical protein [Methylophaga sp.]THK40239.1 hypothetical protein E8Q33_14920 [Methylophaga sp. SB9B]HCD06059.1 hypothetical protein [Methylophaga sp.]|tara:strand:+ start:15797 stop:16684 length:888 start_codon:yes stop_codon:yes gene_type:complete